MEIRIEAAELRKRSIFLATPMYGGQCFGSYARSVMDLGILCNKYGIKLQSYFLFNESLIQRARNYCVDEFLRSDCTHMMFVDSDIGFNAQDVLTLLALQSDESPYDILCGPYPKKCISWEKIKQAVDSGKADADPNNLANYVGDYVFSPAMEEGVESVSIRLDQPAEVLESGTGFMMIRRETFTKFAAEYPTTAYLPDHVRTTHFDGSRKIHAYFDCVIDPKSQRYLSEDYYFCQKSRAAGMKVWICPWMKLTHTGTHIFGGSLSDLAELGAHPTADSKQLKKEPR